MKYKTIVIDPPWNQLKTGLRKVRPNQTREMPYKLMTIEEIKKFPIKDFTDEDCHIYLWTTNKFLREAFEVLEKWGFKFHCILVWKKPTGVTPYSFQFVNEFVLFGYKGKFKINKMGIPTTFEAPVTKHSEKPDIIYRIAEQVSDSPRIDIFARRKIEGWDAWGDEAPNETQKIIKGG
jgi:N6-adenosine-specific RNA methylase IME4